VEQPRDGGYRLRVSQSDSARDSEVLIAFDFMWATTVPGDEEQALRPSDLAVIRARGLGWSDLATRGEWVRFGPSAARLSSYDYAQ
jgi:hypothetical protein